MSDQELLARLRFRLAAIIIDIQQLTVERNDLLRVVDYLEKKEGPVNDTVSGS